MHWKDVPARHVASGDYQQTKGIRSEKKIPVGKLFGLKKHDFISTVQGTGFVKGKRSSGYFALETILGEKIHASALHANRLPEGAVLL